MRIFITLLVLSLFSPTVFARIYHYETDDGHKVYVDNISRVPQQYRDQLDIREEPERFETEEIELQQQSLYLESRDDLSSYHRRLSEQLEQLEMPVMIRNNLVVAPVKLVYSGRSVKLNLVMDTGASATVLYKHALKPLRARYKRAGVAQVADGRFVPTEKLKMDRVVIGPYETKGVSTLVLDNPSGAGGAAGLLGNDFLLKAQYEIDHNRRLIIWEPNNYRLIKARISEIEAQMEQLREQMKRN